MDQRIDDRDTLLDRLPADGSTIGNLALQRALCWDEDRYLAAREGLMAAGLIAKGRGRGGTVRRNAATHAAAPGPKERKQIQVPPTRRKAPRPPPASPSRAKATTPTRPPAPKKPGRCQALKKSELYAFLWASCDELRGGMDASQYKDYVLTLLFLKYVSDKYANQPFGIIQVPKGASFADLVALKGSSDIGDQINKTILAPLAAANKLADFPDFNDTGKLGSGKELVQRLTNLIAIFQAPALDFSRNRADGDDILGDAYEYLMRHFATESGKSKGQFYTPAEVSRIIAQILRIREAKTGASTTVYDPTCGSGSLLLKVADEARTAVTLYGQEKDAATSVLARMNMILHDNPTALVVQGNTLADPKFLDGAGLQTFDYVVANPPFSDKRWSTGLDPLEDPHQRFAGFGVPPGKQGDYAYLLHIVRSLKTTGRGACILPHGVLFRGNAEAEIRRNLVRRGYLRAIIGLPPNLFYGTGIPACIILIDKRGAKGALSGAEGATGQPIFMVDASAGFAKDGPKNRLRSRDLHRIVDVVTGGQEIPGYSRLVPFAEIAGNDFNLNLPRYIDSQSREDLQDIDGHLHGGIPERDIDALAEYWAVCPGLRAALFTPKRPGYLDLRVEVATIKTAIFAHDEFAAFIQRSSAHFITWRQRQVQRLRQLQAGFQPKEFIHAFADDLLAHYRAQPLIDPYAVYQHLMDYWAEQMQDDAYLLAAEGWVAEPYRVIVTDKKGKEKDKGWACDLVPKPLIVARYLSEEQAAIDARSAELDACAAAMSELEEEHGGEDGAFGDMDKVTKGNVSARRAEIGDDAGAETAEEAAVLDQWLDHAKRQAALKKQSKEAEAELDAQALAQYEHLDEAAIQALVVDDKWLATLEARVHGEMDRISQALAGRVRELAERYAEPLPALTARVAELEATVQGHLAKMGFEL